MKDRRSCGGLRRLSGGTFGAKKGGKKGRRKEEGRGVREKAAEKKRGGKKGNSTPNATHLTAVTSTFSNPPPSTAIIITCPSLTSPSTSALTTPPPSDAVSTVNADGGRRGEGGGRREGKRRWSWDGMWREIVWTPEGVVTW